MKIDNNHLVFSIIAPNYLSQAGVLIESLCSVMPTVSFRLVLLQDCENLLERSALERVIKTQVGEEAKIQIVYLSDIEWPSNYNPSIAVAKYDLIEFATSIKPAVMMHFLSQGWQRVTYMDPDTQVFNDFESLLDAGKSISLTPHILQDYPDDKLAPSSLSILAAGIFNLGFCSATSGAIDFLSWWSGKLFNFGQMDTARGLHVDQRWVDWAVFLADIQIISNPGMNVAYWNLHERVITHVDGVWGVSQGNTEVPLYFFHFSGFKRYAKGHISKHATRSFINSGEIEKIAEQYFARIGFWKSKAPISHWRLSGQQNGIGLPELWRRELLANPSSIKLFPIVFGKDTQDGKSLGCPSCGNCSYRFAEETNKFLTEWACEIMPSGLPRGVDLVVSARKDIQTLRTPELFSWLSKGFLSDYKIDSKISSALQTAMTQKGTPKANLLIAGYFAAPSGVGQIARNTVSMLDDLGIPVAIRNISTDFDDPVLARSLNEREMFLPCDEVIFIGFVNADMWPTHIVAGNQIPARARSVSAVWAWELEEVPDYFVNSADSIDQVFAITGWSARALSEKLNRKVSRFVPIDVKKELQILNGRTDGTPLLLNASPEISWLQDILGLDYIFFSFDAKSVIKRKNPEGLLKVWAEINGDYPDLFLVIKSQELKLLAPVELLRMIKESPRTILIDETLPEDQQNALLAGSMVYISLHRSEGLGLGPLEAAVLDKPVVFTNYGGISELLADHHFPVSYTKILIGADAGPYSDGAMWAEPDLVDAAISLRTAISQVRSGEWKAKQTERAQSMAATLSKIREENIIIIMRLMSVVKDGQELRRVRSRLLSSSVRKVRHGTIRILQGIWRRLPSRARDSLRGPARKLQSVIQGR